VIFTGTPAGVGAGHEPPKWLKAGDKVVVEISGLGRIENEIVPESGETILR
jgi:2-keto-4-pentenoate hydratase/2-oxohepta-3-ene-1,7-dioic acid hydratase in catechol pathway